MTEGGETDTFDIRLLTAPSSDVVISLSMDDHIEASAESLTFTASNWNVPQTVILTAVDDELSEMVMSHYIDFSVESLDPLYGAATLSAERVYVQDNDRATLIVETTDGDPRVINGISSSGNVSDTYEIRLSRQPSANVVVTFDSAEQINTNVQSLVFTPDNWYLSRTVSVSPTGVAPGAAVIEKNFGLFDHDLSLIRGPVLIEGATTPTDRSIVSAISIPSESVLAPTKPADGFNEAEETDRLRIYSDSRTGDDSGTISASQITGFGLSENSILAGSGVLYDAGIRYRGLDFVEFLGGSGDDQINVDLDLLKESRSISFGSRVVDDHTVTTATLDSGSWWLGDFRIGDEVFLMNGSTKVSSAFIHAISPKGDILTLDASVDTTGVTSIWKRSVLTTIHGGGGDDVITLSGGDFQEISNFVIFGDTTQNGERYSSTSGIAEELAYPFFNGGADIIDGSQATAGFVAFGGVEADTVTINHGYGMLYGGSGDDELTALDTTYVRLYGDSGLNLTGDSRVSQGLDIFELVNEDDATVVSYAGDGIDPGADMLRVNNGSSLIIGDTALIKFEGGADSSVHDFNNIQAKIQTLITVDVDHGVNATADTIFTGSGADIVVAGMGGDTIHATVGISDLLIGDSIVMTRSDESTALRVAVENRVGHPDVFIGSLRTSTAIGGTGVDAMATDGYYLLQEYGTAWLSGNIDNFQVTQISPEEEARAKEKEKRMKAAADKKDRDEAELEEKLDAKKKEKTKRSNFNLNLMSSNLVPIEARLFGGTMNALGERLRSIGIDNELFEQTEDTTSNRSLAAMLNRQENLGARDSLIPESVNAGATPQAINSLEAVENVNDLVPELAIDPAVLEALATEETETFVDAPLPDVNLESPPEEAEQGINGEQTNETIPDVPPPVTPSNVIDQLLGQAEDGGPDNGQRDLEASDQQDVAVKNPGLQSLAKNLGCRLFRNYSVPFRRRLAKPL